MILAIDVDGVCAEFHPAYTKTASIVLNKEFYGPIYGDSWHIEETLGLTPDEADKVWGTVNAPDYAASLASVEHAKEVIHRLAARHQVVFVTSPLKTSPTWHFDRRKWLTENYGDVVHHYISTSSKFFVDADILIEDHTGHANDWLEQRQSRGNHDAFAIIYARPYNTEGLKMKFNDRTKRLDGWLAIEEFIVTWLSG